MERDRRCQRQPRFFGDPLQGARYLAQFSSVIAGISIEHVRNPGDVVIDVLNQKSSAGAELGPDAVEFFDQCGINAHVEDAIEQCVSKTRDAMPSSEPKPTAAGSSCFATLWARQWAMQSRFLTGVSRAAYFSTLLNMLVIGTVFGYLFNDPEQIWIHGSTLYKIQVVGVGMLLPTYVGGFFSGLCGMYHYESLADCCSLGC